MIKILHIADLHLDSPFRDDPISEAEKRRADLRNVFLNALKFASENGVKLVLISGDLFDSNYYSKATLDFLSESFAETPNCHFVIAPGNHDPYKYASPYKKCNFPPNVTVFTTEALQAVRLEQLGVTVYGYAFTDNSYTASPINGFKATGDGFHVLCAHADTESANSPYAPIKESELAESELDYAALGHIHTKPDIQRIGNTLYAYSGCIAGRDFSEYGEKGGILVTLDNAGGIKTVNAERVTFCPWIYETLTVDLTGAADQKEMLSRIKAVANDKKKATPKAECIFKLKLVGAIDRKFDMQATETELKKLAIRKTEDETTASYSYLGLDTDFTIRGEFYRQLKPLLLSDDPEKRRVAELALTYGLAAMDGNTPVL